MNRATVSNVGVGMTQEPEECVYSLLADNPKCAICGRLIDLSARNWHRGPKIDVFGSFDMAEFYDLDSPMLAGLKVRDLNPDLKEGEDSIADMPIYVTECKGIELGKWKYSFTGGMFVRGAIGKVDG